MNADKLIAFVAMKCGMSTKEVVKTLTWTEVGHFARCASLIENPSQQIGDKNNAQIEGIGKIEAKSLEEAVKLMPEKAKEIAEAEALNKRIKDNMHKFKLNKDGKPIIPLSFLMGGKLGQ